MKFTFISTVTTPIPSSVRLRAAIASAMSASVIVTPPCAMLHVFMCRSSSGSTISLAPSFADTSCTPSMSTNGLSIDGPSVGVAASLIVRCRRCSRRTARFGHRDDEFLHFLVNRMHLVGIECGLVREIGHQHDVGGRVEAGRRHADVDLQRARHEVAAAFELFLQLQRILRARRAFGRFFQLPHDDMTDHFGCSCSFRFGNLPVTLANRASYALRPLACVRRKWHPAEQDAGNKAGIVSITRRRYPLFHRAT